MQIWDHAIEIPDDPALFDGGGTPRQLRLSRQAESSLQQHSESP
ncbi:hypothetical protein ACT691_08855 [Vibrio metschnikovii]